MAGYIGHKPKVTNYTVDEFTTTAPQASSGNFTLSQTVDDSKTLEVSVGGIDQPQSAYSVTGTTLAFGANIVAQNDIVIARHAGESISYPSLEDGAVTDAKIGTGAVTDGKIAAMAATKLTGSVDIARLPSTVINSNVDLTTLSATNLTSGTIAEARLATLAATKLTGVVPTANLGTGTANSGTFLNGAGAYAAAGGGAWEVLSSHDYGTTNATDVTWTSFTPNTMRSYVFVFSGIRGTHSSGSARWLRFGDASSMKSTNGYRAHRPKTRSSSTSWSNEVSNPSSNAWITAYNVSYTKAGEELVLHIHFTKQATDSYYVAWVGTSGVVNTAGDYVLGTYGGYYDQPHLFTRLQIVSDQTVNTGTGTMYGLKVT